jgi:hypothetical protein
MASLIRVEGLFNVNSTSVEAWRALLSSLLDEEIVVIDDAGQPSRVQEDGGVPVTGLFAPPDLEAERQGAVAVRDPAQWYGRRVLTEEEITELAEAIVREVRKRGPFLSLADFVNRRVGSDPEIARGGAIQAALDSDEVSINEAFNTGGRAVAGDVAKRLPFPEAEEGAAAAGIPGIVKQADLLTPLAPILSARSDTFRIRVYGEAVDRSGKVTARAWCEALVERHAGFVAAADELETRPDALTSPVNQRFAAVAFRSPLSAGSAPTKYDRTNEEIVAPSAVAAAEWSVARGAGDRAGEGQADRNPLRRPGGPRKAGAAGDDRRRRTFRALRVAAQLPFPTPDRSGAGGHARAGNKGRRAGRDHAAPGVRHVSV